MAVVTIERLAEGAHGGSLRALRTLATRLRGPRAAAAAGLPRHADDLERTFARHDARLHRIERRPGRAAAH